MPDYTPTYTSPGTAYVPGFTDPGTEYEDKYEETLTEQFLLLEDGFFFLLQDDSYLIIRPGTIYTSTYTAN